MEFRYFFKEEKNKKIIPIISVRKNSDEKYVNIDRHQLNLIVRMFELWEGWWEQAGKTTYNK
ncbi:hypothetical protein KAW18_03850 [candidate division WOR-3 bacterium]|nr:hypothetical protein [candidate division WOR-3 bacterium]